MSDTAISASTCGVSSSVDPRAARRAQLSAMSHAALVDLVLRAEFPTSEESAPHTPSASTIALASDAAHPHAGSKHAHSPTADESVSKRARHDDDAQTDCKEPTDANSTDAMDDVAPADATANTTTRAKLSKSERKAAWRANNGGSSAAAASGSAAAPIPGSKRARREAGLDFNTVHLRHVALKVMYIGTEYLGFAIQPHATGRTVEGELMRALELTKLISDRDATRLSRCGRTDKGVHACGQVVAVQMRSRLSRGIGLLPKGWDVRVEQAKAAEAKKRLVEEEEGEKLWDKQGFLAPHAEKDSVCARCGVPGLGFALDATCDGHQAELDYVRMLNSVLPPTIRVVSWQPVSEAFNARFSCTARTYRYYFFADQLDLARMQAEANRLIGSHDFRNFCKVDPSLNTHFIRFITNIEVRPCESIPEDCVQMASPWPASQANCFESAHNRTGGEATSQAQADEPTTSKSTRSSLHPDTFCELLIHGNAFLYHQVRCMAGILFLAGRGVESSDLVSRLLDIDATPQKPNYDMAPEMPLVLYDTWFPALPSTPGFDYQPTPDSNPTQDTSFVAQGGAERFTPEAVAVHKAAREANTDGGDAASLPSDSPSTSLSPSPASSSSPARCLYPDAGTCLRNVELVFAHLHHLWRQLQMQSKVHELFVNQAARNIASVRNECDKVDQVALVKSYKRGAIAERRQRNNMPASGRLPATAPLLDVTAHCRGLGLRPLSQSLLSSPTAYSSIFLRSLDKSYAAKVADLKGKKRERHESVKHMSAKWKRTDTTYAPSMIKTDSEPAQEAKKET